MSSEEKLWELTASQHGLVRVSQALALGLSRGKFQHLIRAGRLKMVSYGIYAVSGAPDTVERRLMYGVLLGSSRAVDADVRAALCSITAAEWLDLVDAKKGPIHVLSQRRIVPRAGFEFHWTSRLPTDEIVIRNGIPTTDPARTFIDLCGSNPGLAGWVFHRGLRRAALTSAEVHDRLERESRQGRAGLIRAREIIESADPSAAEALSAEEDKYFNFLVEAGYPSPERNAVVRGISGVPWSIDLFYPQLGKGFEISPYDTHSSPVVYERDGRKALDLARAGVTIYSIHESMPRDAFLGAARDLLGAPSLIDG